jgi:hypothetical protein
MAYLSFVEEAAAFLIILAGVIAFAWLFRRYRIL